MYVLVNLDMVLVEVIFSMEHFVEKSMFISTTVVEVDIVYFQIFEEVFIFVFVILVQTLNFINAATVLNVFCFGIFLVRKAVGMAKKIMVDYFVQVVLVINVMGINLIHNFVVKNFIVILNFLVLVTAIIITIGHTVMDMAFVNFVVFDFCFVVP